MQPQKATDITTSYPARKAGDDIASEELSELELTLVAVVIDKARARCLRGKISPVTTYPLKLA
jgi:hypothetical protein